MSAFRGLFILIVLCASAWPRGTAAQGQWLVLAGGTEEELAEERRFARAFLEQRGFSLLTLSALAPDSESVAKVRLEVLVGVEAALRDARAKAAAFEEQAALETLLSAERTLLDALEIPGAHAWLCEVWLGMAVIAAQRDDLDLARTLLTRALTLDPARRLLAAEAAPQVVQLAQQITRTRDVAARSRFYVQPEPPDAHVWINGELVDATRELALAPGTYLLQVRAKGYRSYAALLDTLSGTRAPVSVVLSPHPVLSAFEALSHAHTSSALSQGARVLASESGAPVWVFQRGTHGRLLASRCVRDGCRAEAFFVQSRGSFAQVSTQHDAEAWLDGHAPLAQKATHSGEKRRLWPWLVAASAAAVGTALSVSLATRERSVREERTLVVDPGSVR